MGVLQALLAYLRKSAGKVAQAIFGWAVRALFGTPKESEKTFLAVAVGAAAAWPLLLAGTIFPKVAAFVLAFVPIPERVPEGWIRGVWIALAIAVPAAIGAALAKSGKDAARAPAWKRWLQGFPVTAALAAAFLTAFVTSPIRRFLAIIKRREDRAIPLLLERDEYGPAAELARRALERGGLSVAPAEPPWLMTAPSRVLGALGGHLLGDRIPEKIHFFRGPDLDVAVNPSDILIQGEKEKAARAHALLSEKATLGPGLQTVEASAQALEKRLKDIWIIYARDPRVHEDSAVLRERLDALAGELEKTYLPFEDWQVLYREILQVGRALEGRPQTLAAEKEEPMKEDMATETDVRWPPRPGKRVAALSTAQLVAGLTGELKELIRKELELAKTEARVDLKAGLKSFRWLGLALVAALGFVNMLCVALAMYLAQRMSPPLAALIVAGALLIAAVGLGLLGKAAFVRPFETTRKTAEETWTWARNRIA